MINNPQTNLQSDVALYPARRTLRVPTWALIATAYMVTLIMMATCASAILSPSTAYGEDYGACGARHVVVYEDDQCWTWSKMGNRKRGVVTVWGNERVVGPCTFARMWAQGSLRYTLGGFPTGLERLRGDVWARTHGCDAPHDHRRV